MLLVDPLAAFFRPEMDGGQPLVLDSTHVEITVLPPLAQVVVVRQFTNTTDQRVEAVLTLPPLARHEVVFRLDVYIGGVKYEATPVPAGHGRRAHDAAVAKGQRAILHELLKHDIQMISIAGIEPGVWVEVQIWSIKPLGRPDENRATITVALSARHDAVMATLADADAMVTTPAWHRATLAVHAADMDVTQCGQGAPYDIPTRGPIVIDCAAPVQLEIVSGKGRSLDHSAWQVDQAGGWEVTSARGTETFRHPMNPGGRLTSDRTDWIFGVMKTAQGDIRVTAPLPTEGIAPNARAMRAIAAATLAETATPQAHDSVRRMANLLGRKTNLAFIGPEGEVSSEVPVLRKLALPEMLSLEKTGISPQPVALEPFDYGPPDPEPEPPLALKVDDQTAPGARQPQYRLVPWVLAALALLLVAGLFRVIGYPLPVVLWVLLAVVLSVASATLPGQGATAGRRPLWLVVLVVPWIAALATGPLASGMTFGGAPPPGWMIPTQVALLVLSAMLPLAFLPLMRGARRFTLAVGLFNLVLTAFVTVSAVLILTPGLS